MFKSSLLKLGLTAFLFCFINSSRAQFGISSPVPNTMLTTNTVKFQISTPPGVYFLYVDVATSGPFSGELYYFANSSPLVTTVTNAITITNVPTNALVYVCFNVYTNGGTFIGSYTNIYNNVDTDNDGIYNLVDANPTVADPPIVKTGTNYTLTVLGSGRVASLLVDAATYDAATSSIPNSVRASVCKMIYQQMKDDFDFIILTQNQETSPDGSAATHVAAQNLVSGIGTVPTFGTAYFGSAGKLQGSVHLTSLGQLKGGPSLHEIFHQFGNHLNGFTTVESGHWGASSVNGVLGGFNATSLSQLYGGNYYLVEPFSLNTGKGNATPYAPLELYLMGLIPPDSVPDTKIAMDYGDYFYSEFYAAWEFYASSISNKTIASIIVDNGPRIPNSTNSQKAFKAIHVVLTKTPLTNGLWARMDLDTYNFGLPSTNTVSLHSGLYNFYRATGGRATIDFGNLTASLNTAVTNGSTNSVAFALPPNAVAWWKAENNGVDAVGTNTATAVGSAAYAAGKVGQAFSIPSSGNYFSALAGSGIDIGTSSNGFSMEFWVNPSANDNQPYLQWASGITQGLHLWNYGGAGVLYANLVAADGAHILQSPGGVLTTGVWQHVALTYDRTSGVATLYRNGAAVVTSNVGANLAVRTGAGYNLNFAYYPGYGSACKLDEVTLYRRPLTTNEVSNIYASGTAGKFSQAPLLLPANAVAWWKAETNTLDTLGSNHGLWTGTATYTTGKVAQAFSIASTPRYVRIPGSSSLNIGTSAAGFTLELWVNPTADVDQPFLEWNSGSFPGLQLWRYAGSGVLWANLFTTNGINNQFQSPSGTLSTGVWQHVALTYNRTNGLATLYCNGTAVATNNVGNITAQTSPTHSLYLGYRPAPSVYTFNGLIDEVALFNRPLTSSELNAIWQAGSSGKFNLNLSATRGAGASANSFILAVDAPTGGSYTVLTTTNLALPANLWTALGTMSENPSGRYNFTNVNIMTNSPQRYYKIQSP